MTIIKKCCVCGTIYGKEKQSLGSISEEKKVISHGYCSEECKYFIPLQIFVEDTNLGVFIFDRAFQVRHAIYYNYNKLIMFIRFRNNNVIELKTWDYRSKSYSTKALPGNTFKSAKKQAKDSGLCIVTY